MNRLRLPSFLAVLLLAASLLAQLPGVMANEDIDLYVARDAAPGPKIQVSISTKNITSTDLTISRIPREKAFNAVVGDPRPLAERPFRKIWVNLNPDKTRFRPGETAYFQRNINLPVLPPGLYLLRAGKAYGLCNITNLAVVAKSAGDRHLAWVTRVQTKRSVPGASIRLYGPKNQLAAEGRTGSDGLARLTLKPGIPSASFLVAQTGTDLAITPLSNTEGLNRRAYVQTDRILYRPGDMVEGKLVVRQWVKDMGLQPPKSESVKLEVRSPFDVLLDRQFLTPSPMGSVPFRFAVPAEGSLGGYRLSFVWGEEGTPFHYHEVEVQEYRKPEFKAALTPGSKRYLAGEEFRATVDVETFFGAKVPGATIRWTLKGGAYSRPAAWDANLDSRDLYAANRVLAESVVRADLEGSAVLAAPIPKDTGDGVLTLETTITDNVQREVKTSMTIPVYRSTIVMRAEPQVGYIPLGRLFPLQLTLKDLDGKPRPGEVVVETRSREFREKQRDWIWKVHSSQRVRVPNSGVAVADIPARSMNLQVRASLVDETGRECEALTSIWVVDAFTRQEKKDKDKTPMLSVNLNRKGVKPGEDITAMIQSTEPGPILVTLEGVDIWESRVLDRPGSVTFASTRAMHPVATITASQWTKIGMVSGSQPVAVTDPAKKLVVDLQPDRPEAGPGETIKWTLKVKDAAGKPAQADILFSMVDQALLAMSGDELADPYQSFYGYWPNATGTITTMPRVFEGGAYQRNRTPAADAAPGRPEGMAEASIRRSFMDTAAWRAQVLTDEAGQAEISLTLPDNLTTWRAAAGGQTKDTAAGRTLGSLRVTRPLTLRLAVPRVMAAGDKLKVKATVNNRTSEAQKVEVSVQVGKDTLRQALSVPARGQADAVFPIEPTTPGTLEVLSELRDDKGLRRDALMSRVPVRAPGYAAPQMVSGSVGGRITMTLPSDRFKGDGKTTFTLYAGRPGMVRAWRAEVLDASRWSPLVAAAQLPLYADNPRGWQDPGLQSAYGVLSRTWADGWPVYEGTGVDALTTSRVIIAAVEAKGIDNTGATFLARATQALEAALNTGLPDGRCFGALAAVALNSDRAKETLNRALLDLSLSSPTGRLALAEALIRADRRGEAEAIVKELMAGASRGAGVSYLPVGDAPGWKGSPLEANMRLLRVLMMLNWEKGFQPGLAEWISQSSGWGITPTERSLGVQVIREYERLNPSPARLGSPSVSLNGIRLTLQRSPDGEWATATVPLPEDDQMEIQVLDANGARYSWVAEPVLAVSAAGGSGITTLFRWEVQTAAGGWEELGRPLKLGEPVRCTALVWGDAVADLVRVTLPIPAGFEMVDFEGKGRQEVRDGAIIYYTMVDDGRPETFRFFLRAETAGQLSAPPAQAVVLRRPTRAGWSGPLRVEVQP